MKLFLILFLFTTFVSAQDYPAEWFKVVPREDAQSWEILPQDAGPGEVILSKRTELGIFSNFGATPFTLDGKSFGSVEGLWQSLKYPDPLVERDERHQYSGWPHTRQEVELMDGFTSKAAGDAANRIYKEHGFKNVSWGNIFFHYKDYAEGSQFHLVLITRAIRAKLDQNNLWGLLLRTGCLKLRPDHKVNENDPPSYHYYQILMKLRSEKQFVSCDA